MFRPSPQFAIARGPRPAAFTLVEMILAMALICALVAILVMNLSNWQQGQALDDGTDKVVSLVEMARAEAANRGQRFRLDTDESGQLQILYEPQPLDSPGQFVAFDGAFWAKQLPNNLVQVYRCDLMGPSAADASQWSSSAKETTTTQPSILFYPDGSCDSAVIELKELDRDGPHTLVEIDGISGSVRRRTLYPSELEEYHQELDARQEGGQ